MPVLVDRLIEVGPAVGDLDVGFVDESTVTGCIAGRAGGVDELAGEGPGADR
jgi:hypothetical protein